MDKLPLPQSLQAMQGTVGLFPSEWREGVYQAIHLRRDVRSFRPDPIPPEVLARILDAAHHVIAAHTSVEIGHRVLLEHMELASLLNLIFVWEKEPERL